MTTDRRSQASSDSHVSLDDLRDASQGSGARELDLSSLMCAQDGNAKQDHADDMALRAILDGDMASQSVPGAGAPPALPEPVNAEEEAQAQRRPVAAAAAPGAPARLALQVQRRPPRCCGRPCGTPS